MRQSLKITQEYWEQRIEEGTFNFPNSRKYRTKDCGKVHSFGVKGKKIVDCNAYKPVNASASGRLRRCIVHSTHQIAWSTSGTKSAEPKAAVSSLSSERKV